MDKNIKISILFLGIVIILSVLFIKLDLWKTIDSRLSEVLGENWWKGALIASVLQNQGNQINQPVNISIDSNQESEEIGNNIDVLTGVGGPTHQISLEDTLDNIAETLDILQQQTNDLLADKGLLEPIVADLEEIKEEEEIKINIEKKSSISSSIDYPSLLISEVQVAGLEDEKEEFIELYNPNDFDVDLTNWYIQRKTANASNWSSYASKSLFIRKSIDAKGYFVIARAGHYKDQKNIVTDTSITDDNSFVLKNPKGKIVDQLGFGNAKDPESKPALNPGKGQSIGRKILENGEEQDSNNNSLDFEIQQLTPREQNKTYVEVEPSDILAPKVSFNLQETQEELSFNVLFDVEDLSEKISPSGIQSYIFRWQVYGDENWNEDEEVIISEAPVILNISRDFTGEDEKTYKFQVKAKDLNDNESGWLPETPAITKIELPKIILINEIQVGGETAKDEFIELYNPNEVSVNLEKFTLKKKTSGGTESNLVSSGSFSGIIEPKGYFLIAPQANDDGTENYLGEVVPNLRYSGSTFSIASNNTILLYNKNGDLLDKVGYGQAVDFETISAINPENGKSIERKIIGGDTDDNSNDFRISDVPTPKESFIKITIKNNTGDIIPIINIEGEDFYQLSFQWESNRTDIDFYQLQYKVSSGEWEDWHFETDLTEDIFLIKYPVLEGENIYNFRAKAQDLLGNQSDWSEIQVDLPIFEVEEEILPEEEFPEVVIQSEALIEVVVNIGEEEVIPEDISQDEAVGDEDIYSEEIDLPVDNSNDIFN